MARKITAGNSNKRIRNVSLLLTRYAMKPKGRKGRKAQ